MACYGIVFIGAIEIKYESYAYMATQRWIREVSDEWIAGHKTFRKKLKILEYQ